MARGQHDTLTGKIAPTVAPLVTDSHLLEWNLLPAGLPADSF
jgi:hypothetical protein